VPPSQVNSQRVYIKGFLGGEGSTPYSLLPNPYNSTNAVAPSPPSIVQVRALPLRRQTPISL
jgi:hypothetical protein